MRKIIECKICGTDLEGNGGKELRENLLDHLLAVHHDEYNALMAAMRSYQDIIMNARKTLVEQVKKVTDMTTIIIRKE